MRYNEVVTLISDLEHCRHHRHHAYLHVPCAERRARRLPTHDWEIQFAPRTARRTHRRRRGDADGVRVQVFVVYSEAFWKDATLIAERRGKIGGDGRHFSECGPIDNLFNSDVSGRPTIAGLIVGDSLARKR